MTMKTMDCEITDIIEVLRDRLKFSKDVVAITIHFEYKDPVIIYADRTQYTMDYGNQST
jgi:hypothetical protein